MSMPKISVIVTAFNVEDYIEECLESILNQSFLDNLEVIMIDDGSTDSSGLIIDDYARKFDNFHAYHKPNEGISTTRNYGLDKAKGEYIHFFDSDDCIEKDSYESLYNLAKETDCDIVVANSLRFHNYSLWEEHIFKKAFRNLTGDLKHTSFDENPSLVWDTVTWDKLYKREFLGKNNLSFPDGIHYYEDILFTFKSFFFADKISITDDLFYYWRYRKSSNSLTQQVDNFKTVKDRFRIINLLDEFIDSHDVSGNVLDCLYDKWLNHDLKMCVMNINDYSRNHHDELLEKINGVLDKVSDEVKGNLNSFCRVLYKMVEFKDTEQLLYFAPMERQLMKDTVVPQELDERYHEYIDFNRDFFREEFEVKISEVSNGAEELIFDIDENLRYVSEGVDHETLVNLVDDDNGEHLIEYDGNDKLHVPISLLVNNRFSKIRFTYVFDGFKKDAYLKNYRRKTLIHDGFDIDLGILPSNFLNINYRVKNNNKISIKDIRFDEDYLIFSGNCTNGIGNIVMENILSFKRIEYGVDNDESSNSITFKIPYGDLISEPVKKWELKSNDLFDSIRISGKFKFFRKHDMIEVTNARNKILIKDDIYNKLEYLMQLSDDNQDLRQENIKLKKQINNLKDENKRLEETNDELKNNLEEFKSRKIIKAVNFFKK